MSEPRRRLDQPKAQRGLRGGLAARRIQADTFGAASESIARFFGTARYLGIQTVLVICWIIFNALALGVWKFDPYPFILLNLAFSTQAAYAAPLILLAQNRQADRDRLALEEDRRRATMQKADTEYLAREIASLRIALGEVATRDFLRSELNRLAEDLGEAADRRQKLERKESRRMARREAERSAAIDEDLESRPPAKKGASRASRG